MYYFTTFYRIEVEVIRVLDTPLHPHFQHSNVHSNACEFFEGEQRREASEKWILHYFASSGCDSRCI